MSHFFGIFLTLSPPPLPPGTSGSFLIWSLTFTDANVAAFRQGRNSFLFTSLVSLVIFGRIVAAMDDP